MKKGIKQQAEKVATISGLACLAGQIEDDDQRPGNEVAVALRAMELAKGPADLKPVFEACALRTTRHLVVEMWAKEKGVSSKDDVGLLARWIGGDGFGGNEAKFALLEAELAFSPISSSMSLGELGRIAGRLCDPAGDGSDSKKIEDQIIAAALPQIGNAISAAEFAEEFKVITGHNRFLLAYVRKHGIKNQEDFESIMEAMKTFAFDGLELMDEISEAALANGLWQDKGCLCPNCQVNRISDQAQRRQMRQSVSDALRLLVEEGDISFWGMGFAGHNKADELQATLKKHGVDEAVQEIVIGNFKRRQMRVPDRDAGLLQALLSLELLSSILGVPDGEVVSDSKELDEALAASLAAGRLDKVRFPIDGNGDGKKLLTLQEIVAEPRPPAPRTDGLFLLPNICQKNYLIGTPHRSTKFKNLPTRSNRPSRYQRTPKETANSANPPTI